MSRHTQMLLLNICIGNSAWGRLLITGPFKRTVQLRHFAYSRSRPGLTAI
jgi:hypothetical protein